MILAIEQGLEPVRLRFTRPMTDDELFEFCAVNEMLQIERDSNGELILMSPTGLDGGGADLEIGTDLTVWARVVATLECA